MTTTVYGLGSSQVVIEGVGNKDDVVVVVDGANDVKLFDICGLGIAYRAQDLVKDKATVTLEEKNLAKIIDIINEHYNLKLQLPTVV